MIGLLFALQFKTVQTFFIQKVSQYLSRELQTTIHVEGFYFKPFSSLVLEKMYVADQDGDTLLHVNRLAAKVDLRLLRKGSITVSKLSLSGGDFNLKRMKDSTSNLAFIIDYFSKPKKDNSKSAFEVRLDALSLQGINFKYRNELKSPVSTGVDFNDVAIQNLYGDFTAIDFTHHLFKATIKHLHFKEKSGFVLKDLNALTIIDTTSMEFRQLDVRTNSSRLGNYLKFTYADFSSFSDFINKVNIKANIQHTRVTAHDIAYFAPSISRLKFNVEINGEVNGKVKAFTGRRMLIKAGKATYYRGDVKVKGLPYINNTQFELEARQLASNKMDVEELVQGFSGQKDFRLPEFLSSFGHVSYAGSLKGLYNKFQLKGSLKTVLGQLDADVALNIADSNSYRGTLSSEKFNGGKAFRISKLTTLSFKAKFDGRGFDSEDIAGSASANIGGLLYNGYEYRNIKLDLRASEQSFEGIAAIFDKNLKVKLAGDVDLKPDLPHYNLNAELKEANLRQLRMLGDTLSVEGNFRADFSGTDLNNILGNLVVKSLVLRKPNASSSIDSIRLTAKGLADTRTISVYSDIVDASINGEIDLNALPAYFKSIVKRYIPSWKENLEAGEQDFDFALRLKRAQPLTMFFFPSIQVPDTVIVNGEFSSRDSIASLNGYIPMLQIGNIKMKDIILDETAMQESLNVTITADQLNITDSLYVRNINLSNKLINDSLNFNVKLSDIDAKNQLDLNGLVEFNDHNSALLSLLPSNVIINKENWALEEKVNFDFQDGRMKISGFELGNGKQHVFVDGLISGNEEDVLHIDFEKFNLSTLDGLTNPLGIALKGELNGDFQILSILKNPYISANINSTDIFYNDREIGDMTLVANMDPQTELVGVNMEIKRHDLQTLKITGSYDAEASENSLNLRAELEDSEVVLFEPFLKKLVSDLSGTISADIAIRGTPLSPAISGECVFNETSFTVNYLKTRYTITDEVSLANSAIKLNDLIIIDEHKHQAVANGSVDFSNPLDPNIDVEVKTKNFMVLNTTAKDNPLYYGKAFGTGDFKFKGPTSNMAIDIAAATDEGTVFNIPLNASGTVSNHDFISFVSKDSTFSESKASYFDGLTLHIDLDISRNAEANIYTDMGKLSGVGNGNITMDITSLGDFEMFGDYVILQGKFTFTAQDFINKIFEISRGGTIRWTGNPSEALINLTAVYEVRTSVRPLYNAAGRAGTDQRVVAQAEMMLGGNLLHPEISFAIDFPTDAYVKDELQNYFSDANNVNQQALSLIVRRSFAPGTGTDLTTELNNTVLSAGTELAFNQLNNVISQSLNLNFVDFNIRSLNEASASIRLLKNRLILTGGVTDRRSELNDLNVFSNQVASDVEALYLIRKDGSLLLRASNRLNNRNFLNPNDEYVSALGLVYRREFDTLGEFFRHMFMINRKKEEEEEDEDDNEIQTPINTDTPIKGKKVN